MTKKSEKESRLVGLLESQANDRTIETVRTAMSKFTELNVEKRGQSADSTLNAVKNVMSNGVSVEKDDQNK